ncbi:hypothetical protein [Streptomyces sp. NPDC048551]|uniref:hypothetical protein n=1 Tax=Streptomyces sp. NPDC048551 TaxID=3155758 RepID=UPI00341D1AE1
MAEQFVTLHCTPCASCVYEAWQHVVEGRLRWEQSEHCPAYQVQACGGGWGPPPPWVREHVVAREGTTRLAVGGPDGIPLKAVRELYGLSLPELRHARTHGLDATPVEARLLRAMRGEGPRG